MTARRLLQATCLLLLSAAVFGRSILEEEVTASITAVAPMAAMPAEMHTATMECQRKYGRANCAWNSTVCYEAIPNCLFCERPGARWECAICRPGWYQDGVARCVLCPTGHYCGGISGPKQCSDGTTTSPMQPSGNWAASQCNSCLPGYGGSSCDQCQPGLFKTRIGQDSCSFCPDGFIANSVVGATECVLPEDCPAQTVPVFNLRSCGCVPGSAVSAPTNEVFNVEGDEWWQLKAKQTFDTPVRMPNPDTVDTPLTPFPVGCADCAAGTASSLNRPDLPGAVKCDACPANSSPNTAGQNGNPGLRASATCVCNRDFVTNGVNSDACAARGLQCPAPKQDGVHPGGCRRAGTPPTRPGNPPAAPSNNDDDDDHPQEWGKWSKKAHKHSHHHDDEDEEEEYEKYDKN